MGYVKSGQRTLRLMYCRSHLIRLANHPVARSKFFGNPTASAPQPQQSKLAFKTSATDARNGNGVIDSEIEPITVENEEQVGKDEGVAASVDREAMIAQHLDEVTGRINIPKTSKTADRIRKPNGKANSLLHNGTSTYRP